MKEEAEREGISANALVNKILKDYAQVYRFSKRFGIVYLSYPTLSAFVNCCPKDRVIEIAEFSASTLVKDGMRTMGLSMNYDSVAYFIKNIFGGLAGWFSCDHHIMGNKEVFHLRHGLGNKWSIFIAEVTSTMFKYLLNKKVETEILESSVTITIERKRRPFQPSPILIKRMYDKVKLKTLS
ncbi:MAG: hypothetical protein JSW14_04535 [Candidatus Bathyarchaeum sp.]|nr:MAG: hypothetical protein JSW14_04535 [Candidatus Bathyarchaeum sp.]